MKFNELVSTIENSIETYEQLAFDHIGVIREPTREVKRLGVCINLTDYVKERAKELDALIIHHGAGEPVRKEIERLDIGAYGLHLALDSTPGGMNDALADDLGLLDQQGVSIAYRGIQVPNGFVVGHTQQPHSHMAYFMENFFPDGQPIPYCRVSGRIAVAAGVSLRPEFIEQVLSQHAVDLFIGGQKRGDLDGIKGVCIKAIGDYASHAPGLHAYVNRLSERVDGVTIEALPDKQ